MRLVERQTSPPDYLTESELITLMEKNGIGTDASIPVHINNIAERNYVGIITGRKLKPTPLGIVLVHGYQKVVFCYVTFHSTILTNFICNISHCVCLTVLCIFLCVCLLLCWFNCTLYLSVCLSVIVLV